MSKNIPFGYDKMKTEFFEYNGNKYPSGTRFLMKNPERYNLYVTATNKTDSPFQIRLVDCSVFSDKRKHPSDYNFTGYTASECYIFPNDSQTFGKIWVTEQWTKKN